MDAGSFSFAWHQAYGGKIVDAEYWQNAPGCSQVVEVSALRCEWVYTTISRISMYKQLRY